MRRLPALLLLTALWLAGAPATAEALGVRLTIRGAGTVVETSQWNLVAADCGQPGLVAPPTTPTGSFGAQCVPGSPAGLYATGAVVEYLAIPAPGYRFDRWMSDGGTNPVICGLSTPAALTTTYTGSPTCRFSIGANLQTQVAFVDDTPPSIATLSGPGSPVNGPATFTFEAAADPTMSSFECRVPGFHEWVACTSGVVEEPPEGTWELQVRARDRSNNRSAVASWPWVVDEVAPETTLLDGPSGTVSSTSATLAFGSSEEGDFLCRLDAGEQEPCASGVGYTDLAEGAHSFEVWARDGAGNVDDTPAVLSWTVDSVAPDTTTVSGPPATTLETAAAMEFGSTEAGGGFACQLDSGARASCSSPHAVSGLGAGPHTLRVWASDAVGNEDPTPAVFSWTVEAPPDPGPDPPGPGPDPPAPGPDPAPGPSPGPSSDPPPTGPPAAAPAAASPAQPPPAGPVRSLRAASAIALASGGLKITGGSVRLSVTCPAKGACSGSVTLATGRVVLGRTSYALAAGQRKIVRVKLSKKGARLVRRLTKVRVKVTATTANTQAAQSWTKPLQAASSPA